MVRTCLSAVTGDKATMQNLFLAWGFIFVSCRPPSQGGRESYLSFSVLMATRPRMMPMIQNRTMIFGSAQPFSSK